MRTIILCCTPSLPLFQSAPTQILKRQVLLKKKMLEGAGIKPGSLGLEPTLLTTGPLSQPTDQQVERVPKVARVQQRPEK